MGEVMTSKALRLVLASLLTCALLSTPLAAQGPACSPSVRASVGALQPYLDEPWQLIAGGSVRLCVLGRLSVEPGVAVSPGSEYERWYAVPNVLVDLRGPGRRVTPYAIGGVGYGREHDTHVTWHRDYIAWYGGIGVRVTLNDRMFAAPEFRLGDDEGRFVIGIGYRIGGS